MLDLTPNRWHERMIRVLVVDESPLFRRALIVALEGHPDIEVVAEASEGTAALKRARELTPDVAFVAIRVPGGGARMALSLRETVPGMEVAVLTAADDLPDSISAIRSGARGFVPRDTAASYATDVARALVAGRPVLQPTVATLVQQEYDRLGRQHGSVQQTLDPPRLDPRESAVLAGLAQGKSLREVADSLGLAPVTTANLCRNSLDKLHRYARAEGVLFAAMGA